jgi:hypothetical protein
MMLVNQVIILFLLLYFLFFSCKGPLEQKELKLAHGLPTDHPVTGHGIYGATGAGIVG